MVTIDRFERILRRIVWPICENGRWRRRKNRESTLITKIELLPLSSRYKTTMIWACS